MQHLELEGTLTDRDVKQHIAHAFRVGEGAQALRISFDYAPGRLPEGFNALHLTLFDPDGFRGARHRPGEPRDGGVHHTVELSPAHATPGYLPGPIPAGEWSIVIDTHMILPVAPVRYRIAIDVSSEPQQAAAPVPRQAQAPERRSSGWYRGDLHGHTVHSDASWQISDLVARAREFQLNFVTLSDHNTISGLAEFEHLAAPDLCPIAGQELTTYWGHALALGLRHWVDWRVRPGARSMPQIAAEVDTAGGLFVIAHPMSVGDPVCTGCDWRYRDMLPGPARCVEVWNGGLWEGESHNEDALALWYSWLNAGHRLVGTAGTDVHGPPPAGVRPGFNVVYAEQLSERAILDAVARGHLYLSDGPRLELRGRAADGALAMMGDTLARDGAVLEASWQGAGPGDELHLIAAGRAQDAQPASEGGRREWDVSGQQAAWYTLELRAPGGRLRAVTNPIFF
jgi:hypothetical protein